MTDFDFIHERFGFRWGPAHVERTTDDPRFGVVLTIWSNKQQVEVRVTPSGFIRLHEIKNVDEWRNKPIGPTL